MSQSLWATVADMLLTLTVTGDRVVFPGRGGKANLDELPQRVREELGLHGLNISTDLLAGADRHMLTRLRDRADKSRCSFLLLIEREALAFGAARAASARAAQDRASRVLQAAALLGCNSASIVLAGADDEATFERTVERLKPVVDQAERLEINCLIAPAPGLTEVPERVTDLIKKVGGFRIGTFPSFGAAMQAEDPTAYLRRITPYASVVSATTVEFGEIEDEPEEPASKPEKSQAAKEAPPPPDDDAGDDELMSGLEALLEDVLDAPAAPHTAYDLVPLVKAVLSVGYDGTLAIDYTGEGDVTLGIEQSRDALEEALEVAAGE